MKKLFTVSIGLLVAVFVVLPHFAFASDGVHVSRPTVQHELDDLFSEFSRRVVINSILESTGDLMNKIIRNQNVQIYPQMASLAVQQIALQVFRNESFMETCRDAYNQGLDLIKEQQSQGLSQEVVQNNVRVLVKKILDPIQEDRQYKHIFEKILEHTLKEQQRIIVLQAAQRQMQLMAVQQQFNQIQQSVMKAYLSGITSKLH